ncbi:MAG TPA: hypothetical protein VMT52_12680 [Planctomycetota bacterium]|nr:hypothetical protein [Planctomycetota bacterium]
MRSASRKFVFWYSAALASTLLAPVSARAALVSLSLGELAAKSTSVITGEVTALRSYRAPFLNLGEVIFTDVTIRVESVLKGEPEIREITIQVLGGNIGRAFQICPDSARYEKGEKVLVFVKEYNGRIWNTGWLQGKYRLIDPSNTDPGNTEPSDPAAAGGVLVKGDAALPIENDVPLETLRAALKALSPSSPAPGGSSRESSRAGRRP